MFTKKPTLLLDMDGPLAGFDAALWSFCMSYRIEMDITGLDDPNRKYYMTENMVNQKDRSLVRYMIDKSSFFRTLPVTPGAKEGVIRLMEHFDVWVCTKPLDSSRSGRSDKMFWIERNFPNLYTKVIMAPKKSMVVGDILLDDAPALDCIDQAVWKPVVFKDTFNGEKSNWAHLPHWSWGDSIDILKENLWK